MITGTVLVGLIDHTQPKAPWQQQQVQTNCLFEPLAPPLRKTATCKLEWLARTTGPGPLLPDRGASPELLPRCCCAASAAVLVLFCCYCTATMLPVLLLRCCCALAQLCAVLAGCNLKLQLRFSVAAVLLRGWQSSAGSESRAAATPPMPHRPYAHCLTVTDSDSRSLRLGM
jgi:hypothetical protein